MKNEFLVKYEQSINELKKIIKNTKKRPNEKEWNKYAFENGYLLSGTIGYVSGKTFNKLTREFIKCK